MSLNGVGICNIVFFKPLKMGYDTEQVLTTRMILFVKFQFSIISMQVQVFDDAIKIASVVNDCGMIVMRNKSHFVY